LLLGAAMVIRWRDRRYLAFGWFWYLEFDPDDWDCSPLVNRPWPTATPYLPYMVCLSRCGGLSVNSSKPRNPRRLARRLRVLLLCVLGVSRIDNWATGTDNETLWRYAFERHEGITQHTAISRSALAKRASPKRRSIISTEPRHCTKYRPSTSRARHL